MSPTTSAALSAEFESSYADLVRYLSHQASRSELARDLAHDTWLRLTGSSADLQPNNARAYLFSAARHMAIDHARRACHHSDLLADAALRQPAHVPDVSDRVGHRQALDAVALALQALPERTRDAFLAHRLEGTGQDELAQRHGVTRSTIERDIQRAQAQVEGAMQRWSGAELPRSRGRRRTLSALLGTAGLIVTGPICWRLWRGQVPQWQQALSTPAGRISRVTLPDDTLLTLDADSAIDVAYFEDRRELTLHRGAAFFEVAHDPARPFSVLAGPARVTVLGTKFGLEMQGDAARQRTHVAVESGRVRVQPAQGPAQDLGAGQALRIESDGIARPDAAAAHAAVSPWRTGWLSFVRTPLAEAARRLARYRQHPVQVASDVAGLPVSGEVRIELSDEWLQLLPRTLPVRVQTLPDGTLALMAR